MHADWCITGARISDPRTRFFEVIFDITNLHEWSGSSYTSQTMSTRSNNSLPQTWTLDFPDPEPDLLPEDGGTLTLTPKVSAAAPSTRGFSVSTNTRVKIELEDGASLQNLLTRYGRPLATLMTILSGTESSIREVELRDEGNAPMHAYGTLVDTNAPRSTGDLLLTRQDVKQDLHTGWLKTARDLSPVPEILASIWAGSIRTIETESLTLATTAEALHRLLCPEAKRFTPTEIQESLSALPEASIPDPVKKSFEEALKQYWADKSYPQRIEELAGPIAEAVPSCVGKLNKWKREVSNLRIQLAHGFSKRSRGVEDLARVSALTQSLRWTLTFRLLLQSGVAPAELHRATEKCERYQRDVRHWMRTWPEIFSSSARQEAP